MRWLRLNSDKVLLALVFLICVLLGIGRLDYAGDGMRHLQPILEDSHPTLGEPRWLLFPVLLFAIIKPLAVVGVIHSVLEAARAFCIFNVICGFLYLLCLRRWLTDFSPYQRSLVLLLAASVNTFLTLCTDIIEPTPAVLIAIAGITFARFSRRLPDRSRILFASGAVALASLVYQGLFFAFFFLPAVFSLSAVSKPRVALRIALSAAAVPLITVCLLCLTGDSPGNGLHRFTHGEASTAAAEQYSQRSAKNLAGVVIVGPAYALASIPEHRGLAGTLSLIRNRNTVTEGLSDGIAWVCAAFVIVWSLAMLFVRKQFAILLAVLGMLALPAMRMSQYGYMKFYVLLPLIIVFVVRSLRVRYRYIGLLAALLFTSNVRHLWAERARSEELRGEVARQLYPSIPKGSCFLTNGWGVPVPEWPGESFAWLHILNGEAHPNQNKLTRVDFDLMRSDLTRMFCSCPSLLTDGFIAPNLPELRDELAHFGVAGIPLSKLVIPNADQMTVFQSEQLRVYRFRASDQRAGCQALSAP